MGYRPWHVRPRRRAVCRVIYAYLVKLPVFTLVLCAEHVEGMTFARDGFCDCCGKTGHPLAP